jgi:hypothetical protein
VAQGLSFDLSWRSPQRASAIVERVIAKAS